MSNDSRLAFEKYAKDRFGENRVKYIPDCGYDIEMIDYAWEGWQAREAQHQQNVREWIKHLAEESGTSEQQLLDDYRQTFNVEGV